MHYAALCKAKGEAVPKFMDSSMRYVFGNPPTPMASVNAVEICVNGAATDDEWLPLQCAAEVARITEQAGSALEMRRLEAPVRNKPGIDQHQHRTLRTDLCDMGSDTRKCSAAGRLCVTELAV